MTQPVERGEISVFRNALEAQHTSVMYKRGSGRTYRACERIADYLLTQPHPDVVIVWRIPVFTWTQHIEPMLMDVLRRKRITEEPAEWHGSTLRIFVGSNAYRIVFWVAGLHKDKLHGVHPAHWVYDEGECFDYEFMDWLRHMTENEPLPDARERRER